jgi:hypothetical protein
MSFSYYRCDWIHPENGEPVTIYYEVDSGGDVPRIIDIFVDGHRECTSVVDFIGREYEMHGIDSLVDGSFYDGVRGLLDRVFAKGGPEPVSMTSIVAERFEAEWMVERPSPGSRLH